MSKDELDSEQRAAVAATEKAIAVLAGPGSGKTRVLSQRARHLLHRDPKSRALLLTFTNKAAAEMKSRAQDAAAVTSARLRACNFHTFGVDVLRAHGKVVGIDPGFEILDADEAAELVDRMEAGRFQNFGKGLSPYRLRRQSPPKHLEAFAAKYEDLKRSEGVVDFDDLVVYTALLFERRPDIASAYSSRFAHILIDEFQDTNAVQFATVRCLSSGAATVSVFADDDQAIFGFAGADQQHIRSFIEELGARPYHLTTNYRCRSAIVERANRLLEADNTSSGRRMRSHMLGGEVESRRFSNIQEEANWIATDIARQIDEGVPPDHIAVLARKKDRAVEIFKRLADAAVPVSDWLGERYSKEERRALRTCLAVIRPTLTLRQAASLRTLFKLRASETLETPALLAENIDLPGVSELVELTRHASTKLTVLQMVRLVQTSLEGLDPDHTGVLNDVIEAVEAFAAHDSEFTLEHLLGELALGGAYGAPTAGGGVKVATLHRTKGLQWPQVYLVGLEAGEFPDFRCRTPEDVASERRVCFVGICRAEGRLVLSGVQAHRGYPKLPSIFLGEMGF